MVVAESLDANLVDLLPDFALVVDDKEQVVAWNRTAEQVFGYPAAEAIGQHIHDVLATEALTQQSLVMMRNHLQHSTYWEGNVAFNQRDGQRGWYFVRARKLLLRNGATGIFIVNTYLAEHEIRHHIAQEALDYSQKELGSILSAAGDMILSYDIQEQALAFISPSCQELTGYTEHELMDGQHLFLDMITADYRDRVQQALNEVKIGETVKVEYSLRRKDGEQRWVLSSVTPVADADGRRARVICVVTDTTAMRELTELKSRMIRMASHDLNNPLSTAMGYFGLLVDDLDHVMTDAQRWMVEHIIRSHDRIAMILAELLDYEHMSGQKLELSRVDLVEMVRQVIDEFAFQLQEKQHALAFHRPDDALWINAAPSQLQHAIINYVGNAIKYTPLRGQIDVRIFTENKRVRLEVTDTGIGVPEEHRDNLFKAFFRAKQPGTEKIPGTGLGLSLVKSIISQHGGEVYYRNEAEAGSTFGFWLPTY